nr:heat shock 70 kDa protein, mitochondrial [Tanacetum cinerariifolium]
MEFGQRDPMLVFYITSTSILYVCKICQAIAFLSPGACMILSSVDLGFPPREVPIYVIDVHGIINELIVSALSYELNNKERLIVVFHLGYSTFDVSILEISNGVFEVHQHLNMETLEMSWSPWYAETGQSGSPQNVTKM